MAENLLSNEIFKTIKEELPNNQAELKKVAGIVVYEVQKGGQLAATWTMDLKAPPGDVYQGQPKNGAKANVTVSIEDEVFVALAAGEMDPVKAFMSGKVKAKGNIMMLQKLSNILKSVNTKSKM